MHQSFKAPLASQNRTCLQFFTMPLKIGHSMGLKLDFDGNSVELAGEDAFESVRIQYRGYPSGGRLTMLEREGEP
mgnify:CR=1 FL=1